jgi:hypothetical protein
MIMEELVRLLAGIVPMWAIICMETLVIMLAMAVDFASGYYKAKLRGEERNSLGLKRTVSKFILYVGSVMIASGVDSIFFVCGFWEMVHLPALRPVPVVSTVISVFICAVEIRSVWEKAERKQKRDALRTAEALVKLMGRETAGEKLEGIIHELKSDNNKID